MAEEGVSIKIGDKEFLVTPEFKEELEKRDQAHKQELNELTKKRQETKENLKVKPADDDSWAEKFLENPGQARAELEASITDKVKESVLGETTAMTRRERFVDKFFDQNKQFDRNRHEELVNWKLGSVADVYEKDGEGAAIKKLAEVMGEILVITPQTKENSKTEKKEEKPVILEGAPQQTPKTETTEEEEKVTTLGQVIKNRRAARRAASKGKQAQANA